MTDTFTPPDVNDILAGGASAFSWKDTPIGGSLTGIVLSSQTVQENDFDTGEPKFYANGDPCWQVIIELQTELKDDGDDDGIRRFYCSGQKLTALRRSLARSREKLAVGGSITATFDHTEPAKNARHNDRKIFTVEYTPPGATVQPLPPAPAATATQSGVFDIEPPAKAEAVTTATITQAMAAMMAENGMEIPPGVTIAG